MQGIIIYLMLTRDMEEYRYNALDINVLCKYADFLWISKTFDCRIGSRWDITSELADRLLKQCLSFV